MKAAIDLPPTTNHAYGISRSRMYKTDKCRAWEATAGFQVKRVWDRKPVEGEVWVGIEMFYKYNRDVDGSIKLILDLLASIGVMENDRQVMSLQVSKEKVSKDPCVVVTVLPFRE